jgi:hypothetical protein
MAFSPKHLIRRAIALVRKPAPPSGSPSTVGAAKPGEPRGPKASTAAKR